VLLLLLRMRLRLGEEDVVGLRNKQVALPLAGLRHIICAESEGGGGSAHDGASLSVSGARLAGRSGWLAALLGRLLTCLVGRGLVLRLAGVGRGQRGDTRRQLRGPAEDHVAASGRLELHNVGETPAPLAGGTASGAAELARARPRPQRPLRLSAGARAQAITMIRIVQRDFDD
jgi:hypothetical protein